MPVPNEAFEEACILGLRYRKFNDDGNHEAYQKTHSEFRELKELFPDFNDKVTLSSAYLAGYTGQIVIRKSEDK